MHCRGLDEPILLVSYPSLSPRLTSPTSSSSSSSSFSPVAGFAVVTKCVLLSGITTAARMQHDEREANSARLQTDRLKAARVNGAPFKPKLIMSGRPKRSSKIRDHSPSERHCPFTSARRRLVAVLSRPCTGLRLIHCCTQSLQSSRSVSHRSPV